MESQRAPGSSVVEEQSFIVERERERERMYLERKEGGERVNALK